MSGNLKLFALGASADFATRTAARLGSTLSAHEEREFEDGEHKARALVNVRGDDVYVIHSLHGDASQSPNDKLVRMLFFLGSLRDAGAARVTAVVPYLAYARKDQRSKSRDPVATRYVARFFESVGCDALLTIDVHNVAAFENAFRCRADNLSAAGVLADHFVPLVGASAVTVVSPDAGGIKRADRFRTLLARRLGRAVGSAFVEKYRSEGEIRGGELVGDVRATTAIVVDDLVSAGRTIERAAAACASHGASRVFGAATHGVFSGEADAVLGPSRIERLVVTDTVGTMRLADPALISRIERVSVAPLIGEAIARLHAGGSIEDLMPA
ncbi:MAG TPA: ribose-phosphate pyrophosphokinase [Usitatibacter sp.]|nr:ribose-phosphate pyrophosphokinase [Usitatibacter sp.]